LQWRYSGVRVTVVLLCVSVAKAKGGNSVLLEQMPGVQQEESWGARTNAGRTAGGKLGSSNKCRAYSRRKAGELEPNLCFVSAFQPHNLVLFFRACSIENIKRATVYGRNNNIENGFNIKSNNNTINNNNTNTICIIVLITNNRQIHHNRYSPAP
jgi:hypothetical protein